MKRISNEAVICRNKNEKVILRCEGMFAKPSRELFFDDQHVGTVYTWNNGSEETIWFDKKTVERDCTARLCNEHADGWQIFFLFNK